MKLTKENKFTILICFISLCALCDNLALIFIKLLAECIIAVFLWVIIEGIKFIREDLPKVKKKVDYIKNGIDTRPIIEQLNEAYGKKKKK